MNIGIVIGMFNEEIAKKMLAAAETYCKEKHIAIKEIRKTLGSFDVPLPIKELAQRPDIDAVIVLGAIVQGGTYHDVIIAQSTAKTLQELSLLYNKPVTLGISGPRMTWEEGLKRAEEYAVRAIEAAIPLMEVKPC